VTSASNAALAVEGSHIAPVFAEERPTDRKGSTDFNDLHLAEGQNTVKTQIETHLTALGWSATPPRAKAAQQGGWEARAAKSVMDLDEIVERFVPIDDGTGDYLFDYWTNKIVKRSQMVTLLPAGVRGDDIKRHPLWITRGAYFMDQVGFDPAGDDKTVKLNTWKGWPITPAEGRCESLLDLLRYLCNNETNGEEVFDWLVKWMAYPLQNPGAKMASAVIMHGPQGTGKSTVFQTLAKIYGDYSTVLNQRGLEDKFNSDWVDSKLFILAEEVVTRAEMWHIKNELKELVTGDWIRVNPKNVAAYRQRNHVNIIYLSNENQPLPLDNDDRRHLVIYTPPALDPDFYDQVNIDLENGGVEAFYYHLLHKVDLTGFHPKKRPPMTQAKEKLIALSSPSEIRFATEWITGELGLAVCPCLAGDLYAAYLKWCRINGESRPRPSNQFHGAIGHQVGWEKKKARIYPNDHTTETEPKPIVFPPEKVLQQYGTGRNAVKKEPQWLTECVRSFKKTMNETGFSAEREAA
jgi:putative DNA primase/helicase